MMLIQWFLGSPINMLKKKKNMLKPLKKIKRKKNRKEKRHLKRQIKKNKPILLKIDMLSLLQIDKLNSSKHFMALFIIMIVIEVQVKLDK